MALFVLKLKDMAPTEITGSIVMSMFVPLGTRDVMHMGYSEYRVTQKEYFKLESIRDRITNTTVVDYAPNGQVEHRFVLLNETMAHWLVLGLVANGYNPHHFKKVEL